LSAYPFEKLALLDEPNGNMLMIAPPGCGKTEALALRAKGIIQQGLVLPPRRILALAFSNRARDNISARLGSVLGEAKYRTHMAVSNFHGFSARVYKAHAQTVGLSAEAQMPQKNWMTITLKALGAGRAARELEDKINEVKLRPLSDDEVVAELESIGAHVAARAERQRISEGRLDFPDLLRHAQRILQDHRVARLYRLHFGAILIDEFQDLTEQHLDIVSAIADDNLTFAGDPGQAIFSFTGADVDAVTKRIMVLRELSVRRFSTSYRSSPAVLELVSCIGSGIGGPRISSSDPTKWPDGGLVAGIRYQTQEEEARAVREIADFILDSHSDLSIGIIARVFYRRRAIDDAFRKVQDYPVRYWDNPAYSPDIVRILRAEMDTLEDDPELDDGERLSLLGAAALAGVDPAEVDLRVDIAQAMEFLRDMVDAGIDLASAVGSIRVEESPHVPIGPGIHILNAHIGKGQQFDWVILLGMEEGIIPDKRAKGKALEEEQRTLLVMASRARSGVIATTVRFSDGMYGPKPERESRWWNLLEQCITYTDGDLLGAIRRALPEVSTS
jgi:DNA helicase-2/ATP-dependent DNA helicase PcrA